MTDFTMTLECGERLAAMAARLRRVRRDAGDPSYRTIANKIHYSSTTITRILRGDYVPTWQFVEQFLRVCGVDAAKIDGEWKAEWVAIADLANPMPVLATEPATSFLAAGSTSTTVCTICGAVVGDEVLHQNWHASMTGAYQIPVQPGERTLTTVRDIAV